MPRCTSPARSASRPATTTRRPSDACLPAIRRGERRRCRRELRPPDPWPDAPAGRRLSAGAGRRGRRRCPRPLVLFFDEIDALRGESLRSVLRQLRDGYPVRPAAFPASVVLCGLRDVRDYKAASGGDPTRLGTSSPFNIKVESLRLGDFTETRCARSTPSTPPRPGRSSPRRRWRGPASTPRGQPWLVNALAREVVDKMRVPVTEADHRRARRRGQGAADPGPGHPPGLAGWPGCTSPGSAGSSSRSSPASCPPPTPPTTTTWPTCATSA